MLLRLSTLFVTVLAHFGATTSSSSPTGVNTARNPIVDTGYSVFRGRVLPEYPLSAAFLGVPYATPPLGPLRFRGPLPLEKKVLREQRSKGAVIDATQYPEFCIQGSIGQGDAGGAGSEDCLKVNIYAPVNATESSKLPVLFYIHGGGYVYGNPRNWPFDHWVNQSPNVVVVSVYYRLDSFGFLAHPSFSPHPSNAKATPSAPGDLNTGLHDQILALRWVRDNIAAFGGDPARVTINGESAGGGSVVFHMTAHGGKGEGVNGERLFSGAIAQSVSREVLPNPADQEPLFNFYASQAGCGGLSNLGATMSCLRNAPVSALARAQDAGSKFTDSLYKKWRPVLDKTLIPDFPTKMLQAGRFARVPVIVGATSNETLTGGTDLSLALHNSYPGLTSQDLEQLETMYDPSQFSSVSERIRTGSGEVGLRCGREIIGDAVARVSNAWTYRYNQPNPTQNNPGVTEHASENWMMFLGTNTGTNGSTTFTSFSTAERAFSEELVAYWLSFVRAGDPNTFRMSRSPVWPEYAPTSSANEVSGVDIGARLGVRAVLQQDPRGSTSRSGVFIESEPSTEAARCAFIASMTEHTRY